MSNSYEGLLEHVGHDVEIVEYGDGNNIAVECMDCCEVIVDFDKEDYR